MDCKEFEMNIYLYPELSEKERNQVDAHLHTCQHCSTLFQEVKHAQQLIQQAAEKKPTPLHAARLTGSIMSKIIQPAKPTWVERIDQLLLSQRSKYLLSISSSLLILAFFFQSFEDSLQTTGAKNESMVKSVILNAKLFRDNFSHHKAKRALFADCRSPFQSNQYYLNCVKSKLK